MMCTRYFVTLLFKFIKKCTIVKIYLYKMHHTRRITFKRRILLDIYEVLIYNFKDFNPSSFYRPRFFLETGFFESFRLRLCLIRK